MRRIFILTFVLVVSLMLNGCHQNYNTGEQDEDIMKLESSQIEDEYSESPQMELEYKEGVYPEKKWSVSELEGSNNTVSNAMTDKAAAISIAWAEFEKIQQKGIGKDYVLSGVFDNAEYEMWVVYFGPEPLVPGNCYSIAISKQTGKVLNMWPGE